MTKSLIPSQNIRIKLAPDSQPSGVSFLICPILESNDASVFKPVFNNDSIDSLCCIFALKNECINIAVHHTHRWALL